MSEDRLLEELGRLARQQASEALPADLVAPPSAALRGRLAERAMAALDPPVPGRERAAPRTDEPAVLPERSRSPWRRLFGRRWWMAIATPVVAVAAVGVLLWPRASGDRRGLLPVYSMEVLGGIAEIRGATGPRRPGEPLLLARGVPVEIRLRPRDGTSRPVGALLFWTRGAEVRPWMVEIQRSTEGAIRVVGLAESPFGPGAGEVVAVVGPPEQLPQKADARTLASPGRPGGWQLLRWPVRWR